MSQRFSISSKIGGFLNIHISRNGNTIFELTTSNEALESIITTIVIVPVLVVAAHETHAKLNLFASLNFNV